VIRKEHIRGIRYFRVIRVAGMFVELAEGLFTPYRQQPRLEPYVSFGGQYSGWYFPCREPCVSRLVPFRYAPFAA
jgi:hypothetical protein